MAKKTNHAAEAITKAGELKLRLVCKLLDQGMRRGEIKRKFAEQFNCAPRTAEDYLALATAEMRRDLEQPSQELRSVSHSRWESIYGDKANVMGIRCRALEALDKIEGNYAPVKQAFTDTTGQDITPDTGRRLTIAELDAELAKFAVGPDAVAT